jgi:hypothetical protein
MGAGWCVMARVAIPKVDSTGAYAHLVRYCEADSRQWADNRSQAHAADAPYPRQRILDALNAHRPVNVPTYALPGSVTAGAPSRPGPPAQYGSRRGTPTAILPSRAIVTPGDGITYNDDDWARLWLEENGLGDNFGYR